MRKMMMKVTLCVMLRFSELPIKHAGQRAGDRGVARPILSRLSISFHLTLFHGAGADSGVPTGTATDTNKSSHKNNRSNEQLATTRKVLVLGKAFNVNFQSSWEPLQRVAGLIPIAQ